jgi:hypothetical protein
MLRRRLLAISTKGLLMKTARFLALGSLIGSIAAAVFAAPAQPANALAAVPPDSIAVAQVRLDQLRSSDLAPSLLHQADEITVDGKAAAFLKEAGLDPKRDIDVAVFSLSGSGRGNAGPLIALEGRFDPASLSAATLARGATKVDAPTPYLRLPHSDAKGHDGEPGAIAFLSSGLILAGSEPALLHALDFYAKGRYSGLAPGPLAAMAAHVDSRSSAWAVVDAARARELHGGAMPNASAEGPAASVYAALRSVSWITFQANLSSGGVDVKATGLSSDEEARQNIEDVLRGMLGAWRMAVESKNPDLLAALRKFNVTRDHEGVTISGKIPAELLKSARK